LGQKMKEHHVLTDDKTSAHRRNGMNAVVRLVAACVVGAILVSGCGQGSSETSSQGQSAPAAKKAAASEIKIKGLYIGMDIQTVPALLKEKFAGKNWGIHDVAKGDAGNFAHAITEAENFYVAIGGALPLGTVIAGPDGKVTAIKLSGMVVNDLFNAADMDASDFVQQFVNSYNIPEMKLSDDMESWTYTSPDGVKVKIDDGKSVFVEKVASAQERKQSFD